MRGYCGSAVRWSVEQSSRLLALLSLIGALSSIALPASAAADFTAVHTPGSGAAPAGLKGTPKPAPHTIGLAEVIGGTIQLTVSTAPVEVYDLEGSVEDRLRPCTLVNSTGNQVTIDLSATAQSDACKRVLAPLLRGDTKKVLGVSVVGTLEPELVLTYAPPAAYEGKATPIQVLTHEDKYAWDEAKIPQHLGVVDSKCYTYVGAWHKLQCPADGKSPLSMSESARKAIEAAFGQGKELTLLINVRDAGAPDGAYRSFPFHSKKTESGAPSEGLARRCPIDRSHTESTRARYVICADVFPEREAVVTYACDAGKPTTCERVGDVVLTNREFVAYVWGAGGKRVSVDLDGQGGTSSTLYVQQGLQKNGISPMDEAVPPSVATSFGPRKAGKSTFRVKIRGPGADGSEKDLQTFEYTYTVERYYRLAARLGLGLTWAPGAERLGVRSTANGQHYVAVVEGQRSGLVSEELVAGVSYLFCDMLESDLKPCGAVGMRLGVLTLAGSNPKPLHSLMVGVEAAFGIDLAIGIYGGLVRVDTPEKGYEVGASLQPTETAVKTTFGVAGAVGIVFNFTPGFLKGVGVVQ